MRILTKPYGPIDVDERQKIEFPYGIFGFENFKHYVLLDAQQPPFYWLQSEEVVEIAFVLIDPHIFRPDYVIETDGNELGEIGIQSKEDLLDFAIVTVPDNPAQMTANLQGPIILNRKTRVGRQLINTNPKWKIRHTILEELAAVGQESC